MLPLYNSILLLSIDDQSQTIKQTGQGNSYRHWLFVFMINVKNPSLVKSINDFFNIYSALRAKLFGVRRGASIRW